MDKLFHRNPQGWTEQGVSRGWLRPTPAPHNPKLSALEKENAQLKASMGAILDRLARLEQADGA